MSELKRRSSNWLKLLQEFVEDTESPRNFWIWSGIFCLSAALERRCWFNYGFDPVYPNLYILIVAPPGRCRKGSPVGFAKKILSDDGIQSNVFADSPTKRAFTKELAALNQTSMFYVTNEDDQREPRNQAPLNVVSKELSSFLAVNNKEMIEVLTDLFDSHDVWEYVTSDKGKDIIYGPCVNAIFASTPGWIAENLPAASIGSGWTSRIIVSFGEEKYKFVPIPPEPNSKLFQDLVHDLAIVKNLCGEFTMSSDAREHFKTWYSTIEDLVKKTHDERLHAYLARIHIHVIKVSMAITVAQSNELLITLPNLMTSIHLCEQVLNEAPKAFGSFGRSSTALITDEVRRQIMVLKETDFGELFSFNYHNASRSDLRETLYGLRDMGLIEISTEYLPSGQEHMTIRWKGELLMSHLRCYTTIDWEYEKYLSSFQFFAVEGAFPLHLDLLRTRYYIRPPEVVVQKLNNNRKV